MFSWRKWIGLGAGLGLALLVVGAPNANGQVPNANYPVRPGLTLRQYAFNIRTIGQPLSAVPPYALGFNPYPRLLTSPIITSPRTPFAAGGSFGTPYAATLYAYPYAP